MKYEDFLLGSEDLWLLVMHLGMGYFRSGICGLQEWLNICAEGELDRMGYIIWFYRK